MQNVLGCKWSLQCRGSKLSSRSCLTVMDCMSFLLQQRESRTNSRWHRQELAEMKVKVEVVKSMMLANDVVQLISTARGPRDGAGIWMFLITLAANCVYILLAGRRFRGNPTLSLLCKKAVGGLRAQTRRICLKRNIRHCATFTRS